ncbi:MAG: ATP-grasp domain-containing protein [Acholeplasmatales bacterium]|nr:ATP-grasp domain-containing protein [Acholeplasmatales bacterium]
MKKIAIIGASYFQLPLIEKAKEMGLETHVFAWKANDVGEEAADFFYPISIIEKEEILKKCTEIGISGICSIASDLAMLTVNYVAQNLGLSSNSLDCTKKSTNKHLMRKCFEENGDPSPKSIEVKDPSYEGLDLCFPVIVKPTDRSGSRGIFKVEKQEDLKPAILAAISESFEKKALIEEFAEGQEYSVEYISYNGEHKFLALTLKYTTGAPHFIETGHMEPAPISIEMLNKIKNVVSHALTSLAITCGASHSEIKIDSNGNIKIIEIGGRMGGDCIGSDLVKYSTGYDFVKMVIECALGLKPSFDKVLEPSPVYVKFIFNQDDINEFNDLKTKNPERIIRVVDWHPENIGKTTDSSNRAGCYIYR